MISPERLFEWKSRIACGDRDLARTIALLLIAELEFITEDVVAYRQARLADECSRIMRFVSAMCRASVRRCPACNSEAIDLILEKLQAALPGDLTWSDHVAAPPPTEHQRST